ncbi:hypothetical protein B0H10DRAFT_2221818 [Mycena sp. CBHHK59/15]|nr:hypothetical protein B0H10DRAFT_2221818 [Mycena sp. CBHHK59/15]
MTGAQHPARVRLATDRPPPHASIGSSRAIGVPTPRVLDKAPSGSVRRHTRCAVLVRLAPPMRTRRGSIYASCSLRARPSALRWVEEALGPQFDVRMGAVSASACCVTRKPECRRQQARFKYADSSAGALEENEHGVEVGPSQATSAKTDATGPDI